MRSLKNFTGTVLALLVLAVAALGQTPGGRLTGTVSDPGGAVIPNATIVVKDNQTGRERTVQASDQGAYEMPQLEVGTYTVTITAPGFKTFSATQLKIDAGGAHTLNATLEAGAVTETVTVVAGADVVNSSNAELNTSVTPRQVRELPINGRNPLSLLNLIAGANTTSSSINGQRSSSVNYTRDGVNIQDNFIRNGFVSDQPTVDDTGEFTVITQNAGAEYGSGSTQVVLVTPRGGADFHGNAYEFNRNSYFAANNFFNNTNGVPRAFLNRNQFGGTLSGPSVLPHFGEGGPRVDRGKAFFYVNYEAFRLANQVPITLTTLLPQARNGNFTYVDNSGVTRTVNVLTGSGLNLGTTANQTTFNNAGGALIVDPLIQSRVINQLPTAGNGAFTGTNFLQALSIQRSNPEERNNMIGRFDVEANEKHAANFVFKRNTITDARTDIASGFSTGTFVSQGGPTMLFIGAYRYSPTASLTNEVRGAYQRAKPFFNADTDPRDLPFLLSIPLVTNPEPSFQSQGRNTDYYNIQDNATWTRGNHALRFGVQGQFYRIQSVAFGGVTPTYSIGSTANAATPGFGSGLFPGGINTTDLARANNLRYLLGGIVGSGTQTANAVSSTSGFIAGAPQVRQLDFNNYAGYVNDQWRVSNTLTLNFGLRYELYSPLKNTNLVSLEPVIKDGQTPLQALLSPTGEYRVVGTNAGDPGAFFKADKNNFGPNFSVAYSPNFKNNFLGSVFPGEGRTVIRGGYRINYVNDEYVRSADNASLNNSGLGSFAAPARLASSNAAQFRVIGVGNVPTQAPIVVPASSFGPGGSGVRTYVQNNAATGTNFGTVSLIDPNLQVQRNYEYNFGIQREVGFQSVIEVRYVGGYSKELVRSIDYNQIDIRNNGFLADFNRARANFLLTGNPACTTAGCQTLTVFPNLGSGGLLTNNTILTQIQNGVPADLALIYIQNSLTGTVPFLANPSTGVANLTTNGGHSNYNALQTEFRRRFSQGLSFQANYTFQKILTDVTGSTDEYNQTRVEPFLDNANPRRDYGRALYDRTHTFNFNGLYELPFGRGKRWLSDSGWADRVFGGFQFSSIINISSGVPITFTDVRGTLNRAGRSATQPATTSLSGDQIKDLLGVYKTPNGVFIIDPKVLFAVATNPTTGATMSGVDVRQPLPAGFVLTSVRGANAVGTAPFTGQVFFPNEPGSTGNMTRNIFNGPMYFNWDAGLLKNIRITENTRLQLRAEVFNVLNHANFFANTTNASGQYTILDVGSTSFGRLTSSGQAYAPRIMQFGARFEF
ncbi:MAG TPA: TonB-dependent receptor [Pyrinomonadaceae bacterium]|nr:TonB-dependent receptor [Pyrinomonadaceae bacterium]